MEEDDDKGKVVPIYSAMDRVERFLTPPGSALPNLCGEIRAMEAVVVLMGSFADHGKVDPDTYSEALKSLFMNYPEVAVRQIVRNLPLKLKWLPTIFEIKEALEDNVDPGRKFRIPKGNTPDTSSRDTSKQLKGRRYVGTEVWEDGKGCVSKKFGEWEGKPCIAENDPVRPKTWREQRHYTIDQLMENADGYIKNGYQLRMDKE